MLRTSQNGHYDESESLGEHQFAETPFIVEHDLQESEQEPFHEAPASEALAGPWEFSTPFLRSETTETEQTEATAPRSPRSPRLPRSSRTMNSEKRSSSSPMKRWKRMGCRLRANMATARAATWRPNACSPNISSHSPRRPKRCWTASSSDSKAMKPSR